MDDKIELIWEQIDEFNKKELKKMLFAFMIRDIMLYNDLEFIVNDIQKLDTRKIFSVLDDDFRKKNKLD